MIRTPLPLFLALQALLSFWKLGLLSPWGDEVPTINALQHSVSYVISFAARDVHPPLFYLLAWSWIQLPLHLDPAIQLRILTVLFALAATAAADLFFASRLSPRARVVFLALWCSSPCLLLYDRMCRSYSLQTLLAVVAVGCLLQCLEAPGRKQVFWLGAALAVSLYVHYVPGIAILAAANLVLLSKRRWRDAAVADLIVVAALLPWAVFLARSLRAWGAHAGGYAVMGGAAEYALKIAYWGMGIVTGEAVPDPLLIAGLIATPLFAFFLWRGCATWPLLFRISAIAAIIGFIGVARWVSYPFMPARLLFVLPMLLVLFAAGVQKYPRSGPVVATLLLTLFAIGDFCYFQKLGFRNKQYPMPMREIAALIQPTDQVLVDSTNSDPAALEYALGRHVFRTEDPFLPDHLAPKVFFLRNTHDVSPQALNTRYESQLRQTMHLTSVHQYVPFSPLELRLLHRLGMSNITHFTELLVFQR